MSFILLDVLGVKNSQRIYDLVWQWNFLFWKSAISSPEKGEEKKNSCFQKYLESFWCVICYMICILANAITFVCFLPTYRTFLNPGRKASVQARSNPVSHVHWLWYIRVHLNTQSADQPAYLHLHSKSNTIWVCVTIRVCVRVGRCFCLPRTWQLERQGPLLNFKSWQVLKICWNIGKDCWLSMPNRVSRIWVTVMCLAVHIFASSAKSVCTTSPGWGSPAMLLWHCLHKLLAFRSILGNIKYAALITGLSYIFPALEIHC